MISGQKPLSVLLHETHPGELMNYSLFMCVCTSERGELGMKRKQEEGDRERYRGGGGRKRQRGYR